MSTLIDTSVLARAAQRSHPLYQTAVDAVVDLRKQGETLCVVPQNLYELWVVCTRPVTQNGLGMTPAATLAELSLIKSLYALQSDNPSILVLWEQLISQYQVRGKNAHDARLVAAMLVHGIPQILTFNPGDFQRYQGIRVLVP